MNLTINLAGLAFVALVSPLAVLLAVGICKGGAA